MSIETFLKCVSQIFFSLDDKLLVEQFTWSNEVIYLFILKINMCL